MTGIFPVDGHMDDGSRMMTVVPVNTQTVHHLRVSHTNDIVTYASLNAMTGELLDITHLAIVMSCLWESIPQGGCNGVSRVILHVSSQMQEMRDER